MWRAPPVFPVSVKVGDTGDIGNIDYYTDSTKAVPDGFSNVMFQVLPRTADTVVIDFAIILFDALGQDEAAEHDQWEITSSGAMTLVLVSVDTATGPGGTLETLLRFDK